MPKSELEILNEKANALIDKYKKKHGIPNISEIKTQKKWGVNEVSELKNKPKLTQEKVDSLNVTDEKKDEAKVERVDTMFTILDSLNIPNSRKILIAQLLSGDEENLKEAIETLDEELEGNG